MLGRDNRGGTLVPREKIGGARVVLIISAGCLVVESSSEKGLADAGKEATGREISSTGCLVGESSLEKGLADADKGASGRESLEEREGSTGPRMIIRDETGGGVRSSIVERKRMITW